MKKQLLFIIVILSLSCNREKLDYGALNTMKNASDMLIGSSNLSISSIRDEYLQYEDSDEELFNYYKTNYFESVFSHSYLSEIDRLISKFENGEDVSDIEVKELIDMKKNILSTMREHVFFDTHDRKYVREQILRSPKNEMFLFPVLEVQNTQGCIKKLYKERLDFACLYYSFSFLWYPFKFEDIRSLPEPPQSSPPLPHD